MLGGSEGEELLKITRTRTAVLRTRSLLKPTTRKKNPVHFLHIIPESEPVLEKGITKNTFTATLFVTKLQNPKMCNQGNSIWALIQSLTEIQDHDVGRLLC